MQNIDNKDEDNCRKKEHTPGCAVALPVASSQINNGNPDGDATEAVKHE
jgi:hypothetical protein